MCAMSPRLLRPVATGFHPEANAWRSAVIANGGSVSASTMKAVSKFCADIEAAGLRDRFFRLNLYAGTGLNAALVPLYRGTSRTGTQHGGTVDQNLGNTSFVSGDYIESGATGGLKGTGQAYLNTGLPMDYATAASLSNGDRHIAVYKTATGTGTDYSIGVIDSGSPQTLYQLVKISTNYSYFSGGNTTSTSGALNTGHWVATGTVNRALFRNGSSLATSSNGSDTVNAATRPFWIFAQNGNGTAGGVSPERQCAYSIGRSMTTAQIGDYYTIMQAFQTALGRNV
jgi:hypothetical protein